MGGVSTVRLAKYLTMEIMYRGFCRVGGVLPQGIHRWGAGRRRKPSAFANIVIYSILYTIMSLSAALPLVFRKGVLAYIPVAMLYALGLTILLGIGLMFSLIQVTPFTSTFIREGVVDLLRTLPLSEGEAFRTYLVALYLFWGEVSLALLYVPYLAISAYALVREGLPPTYLGVGVFTAAALMEFTSFLGIILGTYSYVTRRRLSMRAVSTAFWLASFLLTYMFYTATPRIIEAFAGMAPTFERLGWAIPFIGPLFSIADPARLALSVAETSALVAATYRFAVLKVRSVLVGGEYTVAAVATAVKPVGLRVMGAFKAMVWKDIKLLGRDPRRLASMLYLAAIPIMLLFSGGSLSSGAGRLGWALYYLVAYMAGGLSGLGVDNLFLVEGSAAPLLYSLPLDRRFIALSKAITTSIVTLPIAAGVSVAVAYIIGNPASRALCVLIACMLNLGVSLLLSSINVRGIPKEPSEWNSLTLSATAGRKVIKILIGVACGAIPMVLTLVLLPALSGKPYLEYPLILAYPTAILAAGIALVASLRGETLTD